MSAGIAKPRPIDPCAVVSALSRPLNTASAELMPMPAIPVNECPTELPGLIAAGLDGIERHHAVIGTDTRPYRTVQGADDADGKVPSEQWNPTATTG